MYSRKILGAVAALALFAATQDSADAQYYSGGYTTFYQPYSTYYSGPTTAYYGGGYDSGSCCGTGGNGYTSYYGGSYAYGGNPFAPLVPSPYYGFGRRGWFGSGYTAAYGPAAYGYGGGCCDPCASGCGYGCSTGGCATGNCGIPSSNEPMRPAPDDGVPTDDSEAPMPRTYDESDMPPEDDPNFRPGETGTEGIDDGSFPGGFDSSESFKIQGEDEDQDKPEEKSHPEVDPLNAEPPGLSVPSARPISPRNSAQVEPASQLHQRITWRSRPAIVPERQQLISSRPLIVRKAVKVQMTPPPTLVSHSNAGR